jgi:hypothetical protein
MRNESDDVGASVAELIEVGRRAGIAAPDFAPQGCGMQNYGRVVETLALVDQARAQGQDVTLNF